MGNIVSLEENEKILHSESIFNNHDLNHDGYLSMEEFENIFIVKDNEKPSWKLWKKFIEHSEDYQLSKTKFIYEIMLNTNI